MAEDAFVTDFEHIMADDITENVRFIMYDSESGKTASAGEVSKYMMKNIHVDTTLTEEGSAADAKAVGGALATKADTKGRYEDIVAGGAEQLMADGYEIDSDPYLFRPTGGSADVGNREYVDKIVGGTVGWNQLCNGSSVTVQSGHKYLLKKGTAWSIGASTGTAITGLTSGSDMLFDLTAMFGSTIADYIYSIEQSQAGAGVAWFRNYFPKDYYPYDHGTLRSVEGVSAHETVGFNQWDISTDNIGKVILADGSLGNNDTVSASDYIRVIPNATYYFHNVAPSANALTFAQYDSDKNFVKTTSISGASRTDANGSATMEGNTHFIRCARFARQNEPCINLSDPTRNGEYEPYQKHTYPLDSSLTLRGVPKLVDGKLAFDGDIYPPSGEVQRRYYHHTINGSESGWNKSSTKDGAFWFAPPMAFVRNSTCVCDRLVSVSNSSDFAEGTIWCETASINIWSAELKGKTLAEAKAYLSSKPLHVVYELATPTTETAEGYEQYQICDPSGTEEFVTDSIVPVGHETRYPHDLKKKIETAPDSPSADGTYLMKRSGGKNTYMALPSTPSANGAYVLTVTVSGGSASYSWTKKE